MGTLVQFVQSHKLPFPVTLFPTPIPHPRGMLYFTHLGMYISLYRLLTPAYPRRRSYVAALGGEQE